MIIHSIHRETVRSDMDPMSLSFLQNHIGPWIAHSPRSKMGLGMEGVGMHGPAACFYLRCFSTLDPQQYPSDDDTLGDLTNVISNEGNRNPPEGLRIERQRGILRSLTGKPMKAITERRLSITVIASFDLYKTPISENKVSFRQNGFPRFTVVILRDDKKDDFHFDREQCPFTSQRHCIWCSYVSVLRLPRYRGFLGKELEQCFRHH